MSFIKKRRIMKNKEKYFDKIVKVMMGSPRYCSFIKSITPLDCHAFPCCDDCRTAAKDWMEQDDPMDEETLILGYTTKSAF